MRIQVASKYHPRLTSWHVRRALKWIKPFDKGLGFIRLMDEEPDDPEAQKKPPYLRGFTYNGRYRREEGNQPAHIILYTRDLYVGIPLLLKPTPFTTLRIAFSLAHEVGHHIIATRGYIFEATEKYQPWCRGTFDPKEEAMADTYASDVVARMSKLWYFKLGRFLGRVLSRILFLAGTQEHAEGNYDRAAYCHFHAYWVNPENTDAGLAYRQDMELLSRHKSTDPTRSASSSSKE